MHVLKCTLKECIAKFGGSRNVENVLERMFLTREM